MMAQEHLLRFLPPFYQKIEKTRTFRLNCSRCTLEPRDHMISLFFNFSDILPYVVSATTLECWQFIMRSSDLD
jgi:hypothetical protein